MVVSTILAVLVKFELSQPVAIVESEGEVVDGGSMIDGIRLIDTSSMGRSGNRSGRIPSNPARLAKSSDRLRALPQNKAPEKQ